MAIFDKKAFSRRRILVNSKLFVQNSSNMALSYCDYPGCPQTICFVFSFISCQVLMPGQAMVLRKSHTGI